MWLDVNAGVETGGEQGHPLELEQKIPADELNREVGGEANVGTKDGVELLAGPRSCPVVQTARLGRKWWGRAEIRALLFADTRGAQVETPDRQLAVTAEKEARESLSSR